MLRISVLPFIADHNRRQDACGGAENERHDDYEREVHVNRLSCYLPHILPHVEFAIM